MAENYNEILPPEWDIFEQPLVDYSTSDWKFRNFTPEDTNINAENVRFVLRDKNTWIDMSNAALHIRFKVRKMDNSVYDVNDDDVAFVNHAGALMWDCLEYKIGGKQICSISDVNGGVGTVSNMHALLEWSKSYANSSATMAGWYRDEGTVNQAAVPNENRGFKIRKLLTTGDKTVEIWLPLHMLAGFFRDVRKAFIGVEHELSLKRGYSNNIIIRAAGTGANPAEAATADAALTAKVEITTLKLWVPLLSPSEKVKADITSGFTLKKNIEFFYSSEQIRRFIVKGTQDSFSLTINSRPRYIIIAFQKHNRKNNQKGTLACYDNVGLTDITLNVINKDYPSVAYSASFGDDKEYVRCYVDIVRLFGKDREYFSGPQIGVLDYCNLFPLYVFKVHDEKSAFISLSDITVKFTITDATDVDVICVVVCDKYVTFKPTGDGLRLAVL